MSAYDPPLDDIRFVLDEVVDLASLAKLERFAHAEPDLVHGVVEEAGRFVADLIAPLNTVGDRHHSRRNEDGSVTTPPGFADAYRAYVAAGWGSVPFPAEHGGGDFPGLVATVIAELVASSNLAFSLCPGLTQGAIHLLLAHGSDELQATYLPKLVTGEWTGTMNLTEPDAGSDVGAVRTKATPAGDGTWRVTGQKIFITYGEHDMADNIIHLVLARVPEAPPGTRGISCFVHLFAAGCRLAGAGCRLLGIVAPDEALDRLGEGGATLLSTCASYLAELVTAAQRRGMGPGDFRLRRITVGGEVLSPSLARAASQTLGVPQIDDSYSMTEVIPVTGRTCSHGHLHHDINSGLTELLDLQTGEPAAPGALGTVVITPYFPYRDCMPVFRYDTRDVARCLPDETLSCEVADMPATSQILGKADQLLHLGPAKVITPRQLIEAIEALPTAPWPARYRATAHGGRIQLTLPAAAISGYGYAAARHYFAEAGLDLDLTVVSDDQAARLRHTRSDLHETTFAGRQALIGA